MFVHQTSDTGVTVNNRVLHSSLQANTTKQQVLFQSEQRILKSIPLQFLQK